MAKTIWTNADFDSMGWHDNAIHAVAVEQGDGYPGRLLLDIDYIVAGIRPEPPETTFNFRICPATLVFDQAWDLTTDIDLQGKSFQLFLERIERSGPDEHGYFEWTLAGRNFSIGLSAPGYTQYLRQPPILSDGHWLSPRERGGFSFDQQGYPPPGSESAS